MPQIRRYHLGDSGCQPQEVTSYVLVDPDELDRLEAETAQLRQAIGKWQECVVQSAELEESLKEQIVQLETAAEDKNSCRELLLARLAIRIANAIVPTPDFRYDAVSHIQQILAEELYNE